MTDGLAEGDRRGTPLRAVLATKARRLIGRLEGSFGGFDFPADVPQPRNREALDAERCATGGFP